jgi:REP element-mobilizing transposase RayT
MTPYDPQRHHRRSIRLKGYDYAQAGAYFLTVCTKDRACLFGDIVDGLMVLNVAGRVVDECWKAIPSHFSYVELDAFVVMPNHIHGVLRIDAVGAKNVSPLPSRRLGTSNTIGSVIRGFKIWVTKWMRANADIHDVWQRNYYEHVIRDKSSLNRIREYIANYPASWADDAENPRYVGSANGGHSKGAGAKGRFLIHVGAKNISPLPAPTNGK